MRIDNRFASKRNRPTPQQELFGMITARQQRTMASILRDIKPRAQGRLCKKILEFMSTGKMEMSNSFVVDALAIYLCSSTEGTPLNIK